MENLELYDLHCHLDLMPSMITFADEMEKQNVHVLGVTTTPKAYEKEISFMRAHPNIRIGLGLHPQLVSERYSELSLVEKNIRRTNYIGEVGLDFNRRFYSSKEKQIDVFESIINWCSQEKRKVISIHSVYAVKTVLDILEKKDCTRNNYCVLHWFSGSLQQIERAVEIGCYFSLNEMMIKTFSGQQLISHIPVEKIVIESDAPFIGNINSPKQLMNSLHNVELYLGASGGKKILDCVHSTCKSLIDL